MRSKLIGAVAGLILAVALGVPAGAQAAATTSGSAQARLAAAAPAALSLQGCDELWNYGYGEYGYVSYAGNNPLRFKAYSGAGQSPYFCNISVTNVNGAFEIGDEAKFNNGEMPCLAVNTATQTVDDDSVAACNQHNYAWDQWYAINTGSTYHGNILWQFENRWNGECLLDDEGFPAGFGTCGAEFLQDDFGWPHSGL
jgi:hypothetical protein